MEIRGEALYVIANAITTAAANDLKQLFLIKSSALV